MIRLRLFTGPAIALLYLGCGTNGEPIPSDLGATGSDLAAVDLATPACAFTADTAPTATVTNGCTRLTRDTSRCSAARTLQGLSGAWLKFSCRVTLTKMANYILATTDSEPDYFSNYFAATDPCWTAYAPAFADPNQISAQSITLKLPLAPDTTNTKMRGGPVGVAINGVVIFDNEAAPGDDIYKEAGSFDRCGGHPAPGGTYHYHGEPYSISSDDANLIGILEDGYFVYGRHDADGSLPALDARGGHVGTTPDSPAAVYHYHANQQTSAANGTAGQKQWFLTTGTYEGSTLP